MRVVRVEKDKWAALSKNAHLVVHNETMPEGLERIDFALLVESDKEMPMSYVTCREQDAESLYLAYGGSFPGTKGTGYSKETFHQMLSWMILNGYKRVGFYVQNNNYAMLRLAVTQGFKITGVRNFKNHVLLEHIKEF